MKKAEAVRLREGMTKTEMAAALQTTKDALRAWTTGRTVDCAAPVARIKEFPKRNST
jgi:DNA-binding transcriptional regulator YiaG